MLLTEGKEEAQFAKAQQSASSVHKTLSSRSFVFSADSPAMLPPNVRPTVEKVRLHMLDKESDELQVDLVIMSGQAAPTTGKKKRAAATRYAEWPFVSF